MKRRYVAVKARGVCKAWPFGWLIQDRELDVYVGNDGLPGLGAEMGERDVFGSRTLAQIKADELEQKR